MLSLNKDTLKICLYVFIITLLFGLIIFAPKVYALSYSDFDTVAGQSVINESINYKKFIFNYFGYPNVNYFAWTSVNDISLFNDYDISISVYEAPGMPWDGVPYFSVRCFYVGRYDNLNSTSHDMWAYRVTTNYRLDQYGLIPYSDIKVSYNGNIYICPGGTDLLDFFNNTILAPPIPDPIASDIPVGSENNLGHKTLIYYDGTSIKRLVNSQPISLATDNTRYYKYSRGTDTFRIDTLVYDDGSFVWELGSSQTVVGSTQPPSVINGNIFFLSDEYEYIKSDHDISLYDMTGQPIFIPSSDDPSTPIGGDDTPSIGPAITGFIPDQLPSEFKQAFDDDIFVADTDINFNEYAYWVYFHTPNTNITQLLCSDQPLRLVTKADDLLTYDLPYLVRTTDTTKDIHFKCFIYDPDSTSDIYRHNIYYENLIFTSSFFSNVPAYFNKSAISISSLELIGSNYDIYSASIDNSQRYVLDINSVGFNKTTTGGGASLPTDDNDDYWNGIFQTIKSYIASWFIPSKNPFIGEIDRLNDKFGFMTLFNQLKTILTGHIVNSDTVPVFNINFNGLYGVSGDINIIDLSWYAPYRSIVRVILAVPIYLFLGMWTIKRLPSVLGGVMF